MANPDAAFGLRPVRHLRGGLVRANQYFIAGAYGTSIFRGSTVALVGTNKRIVLAAAGDAPFAGVFDGCQWIAPDGEIRYSAYWPASTAVQTGSVVTAWVFDDPDILFEIQFAGTFTEGDIGAQADVTAESGNTLTGVSTQELDSVASGANCQIYDYVRDGANIVGANTRLLVLINEHDLRGTLTGA